MATTTQMQTFTNNQGRTFAVRMLPVGARDNGVAVDKDTLVEFYDTTHADDGGDLEEGFGLLGQFVTRYLAATLLGMDQYSNPTPGEGLCLDGGNRDVWTIDAVTMGAVRTWIGQRFTIVSLDGATWHIDYHPVLRNGTIRPGDNPSQRVPFRVLGTDVMFPPNETPDPAVSAAVLDRVANWLRRQNPVVRTSTSYIDAIEKAAGHALSTVSLDTAHLVHTPTRAQIVQDLAARLATLAHPTP